MTFSSNDTLSTESDFFVEVSSNLNFAIKIVLGSEEAGNLQIRRFRLRQIVDDESGTVSLNNLVQLLKEASSVSQDWSPCFTYTDSDDDEVTVSSTRELLDAIAHCGENATLKLIVQNSTSHESGTDASLKLITDSSVLQRIRHVTNETSHDPVNYKGNLVDPSDKAVLTHLVDEFKDHVTESFVPARNGCFVENGRSVINWNYNINGKQEKSKYIACDGLYLNLIKRTTGNFVEILFPSPIYHKWIYSSLQGYPFKNTSDYNGEKELQAVNVMVDENNPPAFVSVQEHIDGNGQATGAMVVKNEGILTDVMKLEQHKHLYKMSGLFIVVWYPNLKEYEL